MKSLNRAIEKFCWKHPRFGVPRLMLYIVIGNALVWLFRMMDQTGTLYSLLYFDPALFCRGQVWRLVTFILVPPADSPLVLLICLYFYYFIGSTLEREWGSGRFTIYYFSGILLTVIYSLVFFWITGNRIQITASYVNLSLFLAFASLWPEQQVLLFFIIPVKMKWLAWVDAALFLVSVVQYLLAGYVGLALVPVIAMAGYLLFFGEWLFSFVSPRRVKQKARTVEFKKAARKVQQEQKNRGYTRKCAVCGRTDTDHPGLEFRYCSRCAGYHCFCKDHINSHVHFTE